MPLAKGKANIGKNIKKLEDEEDTPKKQAIAIALDVASLKKKFAKKTDAESN